MTTSDFARRHGYEEAARVFENPDYLPEQVRRRAAWMMLEEFESPWDDYAPEFVQAVLEVFPLSPSIWEWREGLNGEMNRVDNEYRIGPVLDCDWRLYYSVVETVYAKRRLDDGFDSGHFESEFNMLLAAHGIPWILQGGLVIPVDEYELTDELKYVGQVTAEGDVSDPRVSLKNAYAALFRKQGGPDINSACLLSWSAWETARESAGGVEHVKSSYPELWRSIAAWQKLIHAGRHPGKKLGRFPTEKDAGFIVRLMTNAVRLVSQSAETHDIPSTSA